MNEVNKLTSIKEAMKHIKDGDRIMVGGFGLRGVPNELIDALVECNKKNLVIISNDLGSPNVGLGRLLTNNLVKELIGNFYNWNPDVALAKNRGEIKASLIPQGSFAESIRAAGCGIPAYYTLASAGTELGKGKDVKVFEVNGQKREYVLEKALFADVALINASVADTLGNLIYCKSARNFNPAMAMAAKYTIALVDRVVSPGELDPESIVTPHLFVNAVIKRGEKHED
ncbi:MAG TPA: CoA transferase subunit A [Candidatus Avacidaminococcus intestinavium]|uniref:CoA transferase subunit A n=1 Tax=Candidatus Avacidaminococcus intestinavium TaxID=2840684 RepID=A0A9D1SLF0_9FIRM|nr:CoA transferase subunit A [Candidatus Avacidaminococcus intestinavium]